MNGWVGKILKVNLTNGVITEESTIPKYERFIGGAGIGFKAIWDDVPPEADAFDPENLIVFATGPLVGTEVPGATRTIVTSKSPQVYEDNAPDRSLTTCGAMGGLFGPELKFAGYDAVIISGQSERPVYLWIHDGHAEIKDASSLWGLDAYETPKRIRLELQDGYVQVAAIGQAGENLVRIACIVSRGRGDHAAAQGGFGAVMGSKKLKAVAVRGTQGMAMINVAEPVKLKEAVKEALYLLTPLACNPNSMFWNPGVDPNAASHFGHWQRSDIGKYMSPELRVHNTGRIGDCPLACEDQYDVPDIGTGAVMCSKYSAGLLGLGSIDGFRAKDFADRYGINLIELHLMIPLLRKLYKDNILTEEKTGIPFSADPAEPFVRTLFEKIAFRKGIGDILAEGVVRAAQKLGVYDVLLKQEFAQYLPIPAEFLAFWCSYGGHGFCGESDPRNWITPGIFNAVYHREPPITSYFVLMYFSSLPFEMQQEISAKVYGTKDAVQPKGQPRYCEAEARAAATEAQDMCITNALTLCSWSWPMYVSPYKERTPAYYGDTSLPGKLYSAATGKDTTESEMRAAGERIHNMMRAVMIREMGTRDMRNSHDVLPDHFFENPSPSSGAPPVDRNKFDSLMSIYYKLKGWDKDGLPTRSKLESLDMKDIADSLDSRGLLGKTMA